MATGTFSDVYIDVPSFHAGVVEGLSQNLAIFNGLSRNAIRLIDRRIPGHFNTETYFGSMENFANRRDITKGSAMAGNEINKIIELTEIGVKLNRKIPINQTIDSFKKSLQTRYSGDISQFSLAFGQELGQAMLKIQLTDALRSVTAALANQSANSQIISGGPNNKLQKEHLNIARAKLGDQAGMIRVWVMHSTPYFDLIDDQVADNIFEVTGAVLYGGVPATYGIPTLVTDAEPLVVTSGGSNPTTTYRTLGLVESGVTVMNSEEESALAIPYGENENIEVHFRSEFAHNVHVKGFAWDTANGGINPTDTALGTGTNWDPVVSGTTNGAHKRRAGVVLTTS